MSRQRPRNEGNKDQHYSTLEHDLIMFNVSADVWNEIAAQGCTRTKWGRWMALSENAMDHMLDAELQRLEEEGTDPRVALAYVKMAPLLAEKEAIAEYAAKYPEIREVLPEVLDANEGAIVGALEQNLDASQQRALRALLMGLS